MKLTARAEYGCVAILELAAHYEGDHRVPVREIADRHQIPAPFLTQILLQLKTAGLVESVRGSTGGYRLTRGPAEISLWDVLSSLEMIEMTADADSSLADDSVLAIVRSAWQKVERQQRTLLSQTSIQHLLDEQLVSAGTMYHI